MTKDFVEVHVHGVAVDGGEGLPAVFLLDREDKAGLPLQVGPFEASAIIIELEGIVPPRPLTHDLLADFFLESGARLIRAELYGNQDSSPKARLIYSRGLLRKVKEVRPSDALALALRLEAPICAERSLLDSRAVAERNLAALTPEADGFYLRTAGTAGGAG